MKTKNNAQETIDNQVKRMVLRASTVIICFALISLTVCAQDLWKQFSTSTYGKMAMLMIDQPSETEKTDAVFEVIDAEVSNKLKHSSTTFAFEREKEEERQLEAWMTDESNFNSSVDFNTKETEEAMQVEDWMLRNSNFGNQLGSDSIDFEKPIEIEPWMTSEDYFGTSEAITANEPALKIES